MQTQITARRFDASTRLREYVNKRLAKLERLYDGITHANVILTEPSETSTECKAEITLQVYRQSLSASMEADTHEQAIDGCVDRLRRQVVRYKDKLKSKDKDVQR